MHEGRDRKEREGHSLGHREGNDLIDPARRKVVDEFAKQVLTLASGIALKSLRGQQLLDQLERECSPQERAVILNATIDNGRGPRRILDLHRAKLSVELIQRLMDLGLDILSPVTYTAGSAGNSSRIDGATIYHIAAIEADVQLLLKLPRSRFMVNYRTAEGETPLIAALKYGNGPSDMKRIVSELATAGADLFARDHSGRNAFHYAFRYPRAGLLSVLMREWSERNIVPVAKPEVASAITFFLLDDSNESYSMIERLRALFHRAPEVGLSVNGEPIAHIPIGEVFEKMEELVARPVTDEPQGSALGPSAKGLTGPVAAHRAKREKSVRVATLQQVVRSLEREEAELNYQFAESIINARSQATGIPFFGGALFRDAHIGVMRYLIKLGADLNAGYDSEIPGGLSLRQANLFLHAVNECKLDVAEMLLEHDPSLAMSQDGDGNTALHIHLVNCLHFFKTDAPVLAFIDLLLTSGCPADTVNDAGLSPTEIALETENLQVLQLLRRFRADSPKRDRGLDFEVVNPQGRLESVDYTGLLPAFIRLQEQVAGNRLTEIGENLIAESKRVMRESSSVYLGYLVLLAGYDTLILKRAFRKSAEAGSRLVQLSPYLLFFADPYSIDSVWNAIEGVSDNYRHVRRSKRHFNEAEMMLLLNHPLQPDLATDRLDPLTRALTATTRIYDKGVHSIGYEPIWNLARIGLYTHGFHLLIKHDCERGVRYDSKSQAWVSDGKSLLESRMGVMPISLPRPEDERFGKGYLFLAPADTSEYTSELLRLGSPAWNTDDFRDPTQYQRYRLLPGTEIELRRGYVRVYHAEHGQLLIRNSSLVFGRSELIHPGYYTPHGDSFGSIKERLELTAEDIELRMYSVLDPRVLLDDHCVEAIYTLLRQLDIFRDCNRRRKFDTSPRTAYATDVVTGGRKIAPHAGIGSPGFAEIVQFLRSRFNGVQEEIWDKGVSSRSVPDLGFAMPFFPAWTTYQFTRDDGRVLSRLTVNEEVIEVLEGLVSGQFTRRLARLDEKHGVSTFLRMGFAKGAELVLLTPLQRETRKEKA